MNTIYYLTAFFIGFLIFSNQIVFSRIREQSANHQGNQITNKN
jgi:hypothetical protein